MAADARNAVPEAARTVRFERGSLPIPLTVAMHCSRVVNLQFENARHEKQRTDGGASLLVPILPINPKSDDLFPPRNRRFGSLLLAAKALWERYRIN